MKLMSHLTEKHEKKVKRKLEVNSKEVFPTNMRNKETNKRISQKWT